MFLHPVVMFSTTPYPPKSHMVIFCLVGVRGYPYGICCPWVRWGWGLDGLGKFFRRRRRHRRRRRRPQAPKSQFSKVLRMGLPGGRNVTRPCTKVFCYPISPQRPYGEKTCWAFFPYIFLYIPIYPLTPIPYGGPYGRSEGIPLRDMLSLGALGMGTGWTGKILPPPPSPSPTLDLLFFIFLQK